MRLVLVTGTPFIATCKTCCKKFVAGDKVDKVYADLDGEPFSDYYCEEDAHERS